jgi:hypothetical protein
MNMAFVFAGITYVNPDAPAPTMVWLDDVLIVRAPAEGFDMYIGNPNW